MKHLCFSLLIFLFVTYAYGKLHNPSKVRKPARDDGKIEGLKPTFGGKLHLLPSHNIQQNKTVDKPAHSVQVGKYKPRGILHTTKLADVQVGQKLGNDKKSKNFRKKYSYSKHVHLNHSKHGHVSHSKHGNVSHSKHGHVSHSKHAHSSHSKLGHVNHSKHGHVGHSKNGHVSHSKHGHVNHSKHGHVSHSKHGHVSYSKNGHVSHSKHGHVSHSKNGHIGKQQQRQLAQTQHHLPNHFGEFEKHQKNGKIIGNFSTKVQQKNNHKIHSLAKNRHLTTKSHSQRHDVILNPKRTSIADKRQQHMKSIKRTKKEKNAKKGHKRGHQNRKIHLKSNQVTPNQPKNRRVTLGKKYVNQYQTHHSVHNLPKHGQNMVKNKNNKLVKMRKNDINKPISQRKVKTRVHINVNPYTLTDGGKTQHAKGKKQIKSQDVFKHTLYTDYNLLRYQFIDGDKFRSVQVSSENKNGKKYHHLHQNKKIKKFHVRKWCTKKRKCPTAKRPVCGSDGHTYLNKCHLKEESCRNGNIKAIRLRYRGQCKVH